MHERRLVRDSVRRLDHWGGLPAAEHQRATVADVAEEGSPKLDVGHTFHAGGAPDAPLEQGAAATVDEKQDDDDEDKVPAGAWGVVAGEDGTAAGRVELEGVHAGLVGVGTQLCLARGAVKVCPGAVALAGILRAEVAGRVCHGQPLLGVGRIKQGPLRRGGAQTQQCAGAEGVLVPICGRRLGIPVTRILAVNPGTDGNTIVGAHRVPRPVILRPRWPCCERR
mmetsp:Transcript_5303/g.17035  ORF Transcript_5303/g.17035 Transcript_5303/m.17035 type:complete len:224 (-) Transcript_5303:125-796(-)